MPPVDRSGRPDPEDFAGKGDIFTRWNGFCGPFSKRFPYFNKPKARLHSIFFSCDRKIWEFRWATPLIRTRSEGRSTNSAG